MLDKLDKLDKLDRLDRLDKLLIEASDEMLRPYFFSPSDRSL
jgi:hypothetical protein